MEGGDGIDRTTFVLPIQFFSLAQRHQQRKMSDALSNKYLPPSNYTNDVLHEVPLLIFGKILHVCRASLPHLVQIPGPWVQWC